MANKDSGFGIRLNHEQLRQIQVLVAAGKYKNISHLVRTALARFLKENAGDNHATK